MDWDKLKLHSDHKAMQSDQINDLRNQYEELTMKYNKTCQEFTEKTFESKLLLEERAFSEFKKFFEDRDFTVITENSSMKAIYRDIKFDFQYGDTFYYSIHFYSDGEYKDSRVFSIELDNVWREKYREVWVEDLLKEQSIDELKTLIEKRKHNLNAISGLLSESCNLNFYYELQENYGFLSNDQFDSIEKVLDTFKN